MLAKVFSSAVIGVDAFLVDVEVANSPQDKFRIEFVFNVGLPFA